MLGVFVGIGMFCLSLTGLLFRLTPGSVAACLAVAAATSALPSHRARLGWPAASTWLALPLLAPTALAALLPPYTWDEVAYGAALPRLFAKAGRLFYDSDIGVYMAFPANYEAWVTGGLVLTRDVWATQLLNVTLALGLAAIAVWLARAVGVSRHVSFLAGLFVLCAPALIEEAPRTKNDVANAFFQALALLALSECLEQPTFLRAFRAGAFLGVAVGIKYSALHFLLALAPFAVVLLWSRAPSRGAGVRLVFAWGLGVAAFASTWYIRNLVSFGNPFFPFMNDALRAQNSFTAAQSELLRESIEGLGEFSLKSGLPSTFVIKTAQGFGILPVALLVPGAFFALRPPLRRVSTLVAGTALAYAGLTLLIGLWLPRYYLSLLAMASALAALSIERLSERLQRAGLSSRIQKWLALPAILTVALWTALPDWQEQARNVREMFETGRRAFAQGHAPYYAVARWLNTHMAPGDKVAIGFNVQPFYYLDRPYYHIHPLTEGVGGLAESPDEFALSLQRFGATLVAFSPGDGTYFENTAPKISGLEDRVWMAQRRLRQAGRLRLVDTIGGVRFLRVVDADAGTGGERPGPPGSAK
jgi:hypothetical protein